MAKNSPLDVIFSEAGDIEAEDFFSLTGEKIDQWRSLDIQASRDTFAIVQNTSPPPKLERLRVQDLGYTIEGADVVLFGGTPMTGLKHIELIGLSIDIPSLRLSGLKSLILHQVSSITAVEIITIIKNSPTLHTLCLGQLEDAILPTEPATGEPNHSFHAPIQLSCLIKLELVYLSLPFLNFLLSNLAVPQLRFLDVSAEQPIPKLLAVDRRHLNTTLTSVTCGAREYEIVLYSGYKITIGGLCIYFTPQSVLGSPAWLLGPMDAFEETFDRLSDQLAGLALADLPLHLVFQSCRPGLSDLEWFTRKANVTWLTFSSAPFRNDGEMDVIPLLSQPTSGPSSIWLLPQLEVFETDLASTMTQGHVVDMIKARHAALLDSVSEAF
ncbi:hypothetical protein FRC00_003021 [Tulasnella sp. 408]|nr:hypothetical protein FRC00_003021 [Tulasnella sp. 408]